MNSQSYKQIIKQANLKATSNRISILELLNKLQQPLDISQIRNKLNNTIDTTTIYRTLEKFVEQGIVKKIDFQDGKYRYELELHHHHHLVCKNCNSITAIHECSVNELKGKIQAAYGFKVTNHSLEFFGLCKNCK